MSLLATIKRQVHAKEIWMNLEIMGDRINALYVLPVYFVPVGYQGDMMSTNAVA